MRPLWSGLSGFFFAFTYENSTYAWFGRLIQLQRSYPVIDLINAYTGDDGTQHGNYNLRIKRSFQIQYNLYD